MGSEEIDPKTKRSRWEASLWELGKLWYEGEWGDEAPVPWTRLPQPGKENIYDRLRAVLGGSIPPDELNAGDVAALVGDWNATERAPMTQYVSGRIEQWFDEDRRGRAERERRARSPGRGPYLSGLRERMASTHWDSICWKRYVGGASEIPLANMHVFGNSNVGNEHRCNLQVAGQLASDQTFLMLSWWITTSVGHDALVRKILSLGTATLNAGDRPQVQRRMTDLADKRQDFFLALPVRQNFNVRLTFAGDFDRWSGELASALVHGEEFGVWVNIEGIQTRDVA